MLETLEGRMLLAGSNSPTNPVPIRTEPADTPTPQQIGAAYREIVAIQTSTLLGLSAAHRRLYAAYDQLAARANPAIPRDRRILQHGAELTARAEQGLVVARSVADQTASADKIDIPNLLFPSGLNAFVKDAQTTGSNLVRSARRGTDAVIHKLNALTARLVGTAGSGH